MTPRAAPVSAGDEEDGGGAGGAGTVQGAKGGGGGGGRGTESRKELRLLRRNNAMPSASNARWWWWWWGAGDREVLAERMGWGAKVCWVVGHAFCVGFLLACDSDLRRKTLALSWLAGAYYLLLILTVVQYAITAGSSPGYVTDAMRADRTFEDSAKASLDSVPRRGAAAAAASAARSSSGIRPVSAQPSLQIAVSDTTPLLEDRAAAEGGGTRPGPPASRVTFCNHAILYTQPTFPGDASPVGRCPYCRVIQPLRTKHCHDCDMCVLRFDHHCVWLGTCVGQGNHRRFWWFLFFETMLTLWTAIFYGATMGASEAESGGAWLWKDTALLAVLLALIACLAFLATLLLFHTYLALTNQTTFEKTRRRRIHYLKDLPDGERPFSRGCVSNVRSFCCTPSNVYPIYTLPTTEDLEARRSSCCG